MELVSLLVLGLGGVLGGLGLSFREIFHDFSLVYTDATDPNSLMFRIVEILTLKGFGMDSRPSIHLLSFSLFGIMTCLG